MSTLLSVTFTCIYVHLRFKGNFNIWKTHLEVNTSSVKFHVSEGILAGKSCLFFLWSATMKNSKSESQKKNMFTVVLITYLALWNLFVKLYKNEYQVTADSEWSRPDAVSTAPSQQWEEWGQATSDYQQNPPSIDIILLSIVKVMQTLSFFWVESTLVVNTAQER